MQTMIVHNTLGSNLWKFRILCRNILFTLSQLMLWKFTLETQYIDTVIYQNRAQYTCLLSPLFPISILFSFRVWKLQFNTFSLLLVHFNTWRYVWYIIAFSESMSNSFSFNLSTSFQSSTNHNHNFFVFVLVPY